jgi:hypothetical protein
MLLVIFSKINQNKIKIKIIINKMVVLDAIFDIKGKDKHSYKTITKIIFIKIVFINSLKK